MAEALPKKKNRWGGETGGRGSDKREEIIVDGEERGGGVVRGRANDISSKELGGPNQRKKREKRERGRKKEKGGR